MLKDINNFRIVVRIFVYFNKFNIYLEKSFLKDFTYLNKT